MFSLAGSESLVVEIRRPGLASLKNDLGTPGGGGGSDMNNAPSTLSLVTAELRGIV